MKLFVLEDGTSEMIDLFSGSEDRTLFVSVLAAVEVRSAIRRRETAGDLEPTVANFAITNLIQETGRIVEHPLTPFVVAEAIGLIDRHGLRTVDSIHLASAVVAREALPSNDSMTFVASDNRLLDAAKKEGFSTLNPVRPAG